METQVVNWPSVRIQLEKAIVGLLATLRKQGCPLPPLPNKVIDGMVKAACSVLETACYILTKSEG